MVALDDLGDAARAFLEALDVLALVTDEPDRDEGGQAAAVGLRVDDRPVAADHLLVFEAPQPSRAGRCRQSGGTSHLGDGGSAIASQEVENHAVRSIEHAHAADRCTNELRCT